jgi:PAS domain-containing protein
MRLGQTARMSLSRRFGRSHAASALSRGPSTICALPEAKETSLLAAGRTPQPLKAARIGVWQCDLPFETLTWTSAVYDIFELPRGFRVTREETLGFYTRESREMLEAVRAEAIRNGTGFSLDAEIVTALGKSRLMRITATVEYEIDRPIRIWGTKQDITPDQA